MIPQQIRVKNTLQRCSQLALTAFSIQLGLPVELQAADFSKASQVYVPPSSYDRRIDFSAIREQYAVPSKTKKAMRTQAPPSSKNSSVKSTGSKAVRTVTASGSTAKAPTVTTPAISSVERAAVKTTLPPPALSHHMTSGQSYTDIARSLTSKMPANVAKMKQTAQELTKTGKLDEAQRVLSKISQLQPQDKENLKELGSVSLQRAKLYMKSDNYSEAIVAARQSLAVDPANTEAHSVLSQIYQKAGADPTDVTHRLKTADALYEQGRFHEAEVEYRASLKVKPTPEAHVGLGKVSEKVHGAGSGKQHFEHALELDSNSHNAHRELGLAHLNKGDVVAANSSLSRAVILNPKDPEAGKNLVKLWQGQVSKSPNANSHLGLARAYQLTGDLPNAQAAYREVVRLEPNHPYLPAARQSFKLALAKQESEKSFAAAKNLESQGLLTDAYQKASEAANYSAGNSNYKVYQGELLEKMGKSAQARQVYMNVLKDDPKNVAATERLKGIPVDIANAAPGLAGLAGALAPKGHPAGFPGSKFPWPTTSHPSSIPGLTTPAMTMGGGGNPASALGALSAFESPAGLGTVAPGPVDHVGQLTNFIQQAGMTSMAWKVKNDKLGDAASDIRKNLLKQFSPEPEPEAKPAGGSTIAGAGAGAADAASDDFIDKILKSPVGSALPGKAADTASSVAASDAAGLAAPRSMASAVGAPATPAASNNSTLSKLKELEKKNQELQAKLKQFTGASKASAAPKAVSKSTVPSSTSNSGFPPQTAPNFRPQEMSAAPLMQSASPQAIQGMSAGPMMQSAVPQGIQGMSAAPMMQSAVPAMSAPGQVFDAASGQAYQTPSLLAPGAIPQYQTPAQYQTPSPSFQSVPTQGFVPAEQQQGMTQGGPQGLRGPISGNGGTAGLRFELMQIKPTLTNVQLKVVLRNDSDQALNIPENLQAIIRYPDMHESEVKIAFNNKSIPSHSSSEGTVKVPFDKVDPTADLVLRNISPQELHLITSLVQRPQ